MIPPALAMRPVRGMGLLSSSGRGAHLRLQGEALLLVAPSDNVIGAGA
jgi:hypothetical protein